MLQLQMRFENFRDVLSLVYIDKNKYMTSFQLVKNINEIFNAREKYEFQNIHQETPMHFVLNSIFFVHKNLNKFQNPVFGFLAFFRITSVGHLN